MKNRLVISIISISFTLILILVLILLSLQTQESDIDFQSFATCTDLEEHVNQYGSSYPRPYISFEDSVNGSVDLNYEGSSKNVSKTNVQVDGIDELDVVKVLQKDDNYIISVKENTIEIWSTDIDPELISSYQFPEYFYLQGLYLDSSSDRVIVKANSNGIYAARFYYQPESYFAVLNISDIKNIELEKIAYFDFEVGASRFKDGNIYLFGNAELASYNYNNIYRSNIVPEKYTSELSLPQYLVADSFESLDKNNLNNLIDCNDIYYDAENFNISSAIINITLNTSDLSMEKRAVLGRAENIYMSEDNSYVSYVNYNYNSVEPTCSYWDSISGNCRNQYYPEDQVTKTIIYKYEESGNELLPKRKGSVTGNLLNQFSMDERQGFLRVASTQRDVFPSKNLITIFDNEMNQISMIDDIAPGESIFSARFYENVGFLVTFEQIDPLFTFDLSDPYQPKTLGELKITGYSNYLDLIEEDKLLGIGREVDEFSGRDLGLKVTIFDISDLSNPKLVSEWKSDSNAYSNINYDHKAVVFDRTNKRFGFSFYDYSLSEQNKSLLVFDYSNDLKDFEFNFTTDRVESNWQVFEDSVWFFPIDKEVRAIDLENL